MILEGPKKSRLYEKGEDPVYAVENKLKIDYRYYFENQLLTPLKELLKKLKSTEKTGIMEISPDL